MRKFYIFALFVFALSLGLSSCTKDDLYRPGGPNSELNAGENPDGDTPPPPPINDDDDNTGDDSKKD